jgi:hypothetical protein
MYKNKTLKRLALLAVVGLAFGGVSAVSAEASGNANFAVTTATTIGVGGATATQLAGPANFVTITNSSASSVYYTLTGGTVSGSASTTGTVAGTSTFNVATPTVGTITVTGYTITAGAASLTSTDTVTITVVSALPGTVYSASTVYGASALAVPSTVTDAAFSVTAPSSSANVANFQVTENDVNAVALTSGFKAITVAATNGLLTSTSGIVTAVGTTYIAGTPTLAGTNFVLSGINGLAGTSTVTISVNGVVVKTYKVTFTGPAVKIVLTAINNVIAVGTAVAVLPNITANTNALEVQEFDAGGNLVAINTANIVLTPGSASTATAGAFDNANAHTLGDIVNGTATSSSLVGVSVNGVTAGSTTFTATDSALSLTSSPVSVRVSSATPTKVVFTTDLASYSSGGNGILSTTVSDASGTVPAGTYTVFSAPATSSLALAVGVLPSAAVMVNDAGVATVQFNAPLTDGKATISATGASASIVVTPVSFDIISSATTGANAATAAAKEATDAANAATAAANTAAASADKATAAAQDAGNKASAALAAVTALSQQVTNVLAKLASLSALVVRIIKKLKIK